MGQFWALVQKDLNLEWRRKYALSGGLLYAGSAIFATYLTFEVSITPFTPATWQAVFWVIFLFAATNLVSRSFMLEEGPSRIYLYQLTSPGTMILAKITYNTLVLCGLGLLTWALYSMIFSSPLEEVLLFLATIALASFSFAASLSLIASISMKGANSSTLMVILGFPVVIPQILLLARITMHAVTGTGWSGAAGSIFILGSIDVILISLSFLLFPYLWRS